MIINWIESDARSQLHGVAGATEPPAGKVLGIMGRNVDKGRPLADDARWLVSGNCPCPRVIEGGCGYDTPGMLEVF